MKRLLIAVAVAVAVTGFAGTASGGVKLQYLRAYHHAQKCAGKRAPGRDILHWGVAPGKPAPAPRADLLRSTEVLQRMCAAPLVPVASLPQSSSTTAPASYTAPSGGGGGGSCAGGPTPIPCSIIRCESGGSYTARNKSGAYGRYQIMPGTAQAYGCDLSTHGGQDSCAARVYAGSGRGAWVC